MTSSLTLLFSVRIAHTYYADGICKDLQYTPSLATQQLMDRYTLYLQKTPEGFSFYYNSVQSVADFLTDIKTTNDATSFSFDVTSMNQYFTLFTEYPIATLGTFSFDTGDTTSIDGATVLKGVFAPTNTGNTSFTVTIDYDAIIRFRESGNNPTYTIQFTSRKTQWRYYIINNSQQHFEKLTIQTDSAIQFEDPVEVTLPTMTTALLFSSGSMKIPLEEAPTHKFSLVDIKTDAGSTRTHVVVKGLPMAGNSIETYTAEETTHVASPIYVYI